MKKFASILSLIIALAMVCCAPAALADAADEPAADEALELTDYTSVTGTFTCKIPSDPIVMSGLDQEALMNLLDVETISEGIGVDAEAAQTMIDAIAAMDYSSADFIYTGNFMGNLNIQVTSDSGMTPAMLSMASSVLDQQLIASYGTMGVAEEDCAPQGIVTIGENPNTWYKFTLVFGGQPMAQYITCNDEGTMFTLTFTNFPEEQELAIVESFEMVAAEAA